MTGAACVVVVASLVAARAQVRPEPPGAPTFVGILGSQGVVVPFAQFDGERWSNAGASPWDIDDKTWPRPWFAPWFDVGRRHLRDWSVRLFESELVSPAELRRSERLIHTQDYTAIASGCEYLWGLSSDAPVFRRSPDGGAMPVGFAVTGTHAIAGFEHVDDSDPQVARLKAFAMARFDALEDAKVANPPYALRHPYPTGAARHATVPHEISILRSAPLADGRRLFQMRAERKYALNDPAPCTAQYSVLNIWIAVDGAGDLRTLAEDMTLGECEERNYDYRSALGMFQLAGRTFIAIIQTGYEGGSYVMLEITPTALRRLIATSAGGC